MPDEEVVETATTEEQAEGTNGESEATSAETENTEEQKPQMIPMRRFKEVIEERNTLRDDYQALKQRLDAIESKSRETEQKPTVKQPPSNLSQEEQVRWVVHQYATELLEEKFGMPLDDIASVLKTVPETARDTKQRRYTEMCSRFGIDPDNEDAQAYMVGLMKAQGDKANLDTVFERAGKLFGKKQEAKKPTATVEEKGVTGTMTGDRVIFKNAKEATEAASKGITAHRETIEEVLARRQAK